MAAGGSNGEVGARAEGRGGIAAYPSENAQEWTAEPEAAITTQELPMNHTLQSRSATDSLQDRADMPDHINGKNVDGKEITLARSRPLQLQLFQTFLPEDQDKYSNTIELYDAIPKYFPTKHVGGRRVHSTYLPILTRIFEHKTEEYKLEIRPARLSHKDGTEREYYPTHREELVEDALRRIACDRLNGVFLDDRAGVQFTLYELKKELKARGHSLNLPDIVEALRICNASSLTLLNKAGTAIVQSPIFPVLLIASKQEWLNSPKSTRCYVQFNPLVTASINHISYRQYDYLTYMSYKHRLSRWLHKRLSHNYTQASLMTLYKIRMSTILRDSGSYFNPRGNTNAREIEKALKELIEGDILMSYKEEFQRGQRNKIVDIMYTLYPSITFTNEVKKANARVKRALFPRDNQASR
jgi:hypothetical protein